MKDSPAQVEPKADVRLPSSQSDLLTPEELAELTGNTRVDTEAFSFGGRPRTSIAYSWQHEAAAQLHGWKDHAHHANESYRLTRIDYEAALKAAAEPVKDERTGVTDYQPHRAAMSQYAPAAKKERR